MEHHIPLCVDLDGTLVSGDLLVESGLKILKERPRAAVAAIGALFRGKACLKQRLADEVDLRVELLSYNEVALYRVRAAKAGGSPVILVTAANRKYAEQVAVHLGGFDAVYASDADTNLSGQAKADLLVRLYGEGGFDYMADARQDLAIWQHARRAIVVDPQPGVVASLRRRGIVYELVCSRPPVSGALLTALRPHQWLKNALVFLPLLTAHLYADPRAILACVAAFIGFSAMASAGYLVNDLLDLDADRHHARKRGRPFASGRLKVTASLWLIPLLVVMGLIIGAALSGLFLAVLIAYLLITLAYSLHLKRRTTVDVLTLAGLYTLRVIGGAAAIGTGLSFWLLAFSLFLFLSLAYLKRYAELEALRADGGTWASGRGYGVVDLALIRSLGIPAGYGAVLVLALYINSPEIRALYRHPEVIWLLCPILLFWLARSWTIAHRGLMHDDPLVFAVEDRTSQLTMLISVLIFGLAV